MKLTILNNLLILSHKNVTNSPDYWFQLQQEINRDQSVISNDCKKRTHEYTWLARAIQKIEEDKASRLMLAYQLMMSDFIHSVFYFQWFLEGRKFVTTHGRRDRQKCRWKINRKLIQAIERWHHFTSTITPNVKSSFSLPIRLYLKLVVTMKILRMPPKILHMILLGKKLQ